MAGTKRTGPAMRAVASKTLRPTLTPGPQRRRAQAQAVQPILAKKPVRFPGRLVIPSDDLTLAIIVLVVTAALWAVWLAADGRLSLGNRRECLLGEETETMQCAIVQTGADHHVDLVTDRDGIESCEMAASHHRIADAQRSVRAQKRELVGRRGLTHHWREPSSDRPLRTG